MNKLLLVVLILSMVVFSISESQLIRAYGLKVGVASTNQNWDWSQQSGIKANSTVRQGFDAGVFVEWLDIPVLSVVTEIHYIQKGSEVTTNIAITTMEHPEGTGQFLSYSNRLNYLSMPLLAKVRMNWGLLTPYILAGPRFDYYLSGSGTFSSSDFKKLDIGGTFGVGVELVSILPINTGVEFRYSPSFQNSYSVPYLSIKNRSMEFLLVIIF
jgi:hypothetical protein